MWWVHQRLAICVALLRPTSPKRFEGRTVITLKIWSFTTKGVYLDSSCIGEKYLRIIWGMSSKGVRTGKLWQLLKFHNSFEVIVWSHSKTQLHCSWYEEEEGGRQALHTWKFSPATHILVKKGFFADTTSYAPHGDQGFASHSTVSFLHSNKPLT